MRYLSDYYNSPSYIARQKAQGGADLAKLAEGVISGITGAVLNEKEFNLKLKETEMAQKKQVRKDAMDTFFKLQDSHKDAIKANPESAPEWLKYDIDQTMHFHPGVLSDADFAGGAVAPITGWDEDVSKEFFDRTNKIQNSNLSAEVKKSRLKGVVLEFDTYKHRRPFPDGKPGGSWGEFIGLTGENIPSSGSGGQPLKSPEALQLEKERDFAYNNWLNATNEYKKSRDPKQMATMKEARATWTRIKNEVLNLQKVGKYYMSKAESLQPSSVVGEQTNQPSQENQSTNSVDDIANDFDF